MFTKTCFTCISYFLLGALISFSALGQECATTSKGNDLIPNQTCAPVDAFWEATYRGVFTGATTVELRFDWGDGTFDQVPAVQVIDPLAVPPVAAADRVFQANATHLYPRGGAECTYNAQVFLYVDGIECTSSIQEQIVTVWDRDDSNGGQIEVTPDIYRICVGNSATVNFNDNSIFNCTPPDENDVINDGNRWVRWDYGTVNTITGSVLIDGNPQTFAFEGAVEYLPQPVVGPNSTSLDVTIPATAQVGEVFEVQLNNWNQCNPYDLNLSDDPFSPVNGNLSTGDSVSVLDFARIVIVDTAQANYITRLNNAGGNVQDTFCIGDQIYFDNETPGLAGAALAYSWEFYENPAGTGVPATSNNTNPTFTYFTPGDKLVVLRVIDNNAFGACEAVYRDTVHMSPNSIATIALEDTLGNASTGIFCEDGQARRVVFRDVSPGKQAGITEYQWEFYDENNNLDTVLPGPGLFSITEIDSVVRDYTVPGIYRAVLITRDRITSCITVDEDSVIIYTQPTAGYTADTICEGEPTTLTNTSTLTPTINGDQIGFWEWDFNYDGITFTTDSTFTADPGSFARSFGAPGTYPVALQVTTLQGACSDIFIDTVLVNAIPVAMISPGDTADCPTFDLTFENLSIASQPAGLSIDRYEWFIDSDDGSGFVIDSVQTVSDTLFTRSFANTKSGGVNHVYQVFMRAVASNGCFTDSDTTQVTVFAAPASGFSSSYDITDPNCSPVSVNFLADAATTALSPDTYTWTISLDGNTVAQQVQTVPSAPDFGSLSFTFINDSATLQSYLIEMQPEAAGTCILPFSESITIFPRPGATYTVPDTVQACDRVTYTLQADQLGLAAYDWQFSQAPAVAPIDNGDNITISFNRPGFGTGPLLVTASLVTTNLSNCPSDTVTLNLLVEEQEEVVVPQLSLLGAATSCPPHRIRLVNTTTSFPTGTSFDIQMQVDAAVPVSLVPDSGSVAGTVAVELTTPGVYEFTLQATSPFGCNYSSSPPVTVTIALPSEANYSLSDTVGCAPFTSSITTTPVNATLERWLIEDLNTGDTVYAAPGPLFFYTFPNLSDTTKTYQLTYTTSNAAGCQDDSVTFVRVFPQAEASFRPLDAIPVCQPFEVNFVNESANPAGTNYNWSWGDGTTTDSNADSISHPFPNSTFTANLNFTVRLRATTAEGCTADTLQVVESFPQVNAAISADRSTDCAPFTVNFNNLSQGQNLALSSWIMQEAGNPTTAAVLSSDLSISQIFENTTDTARQYEIIYQAVNTGGCADADTLRITVFPPVLADFVTDLPPEGCQPLDLNFLPQGFRPGLRYIWQWGDGTDSDTSYDASAVFHQFSNTSTNNIRNYLVTLEATDTLTGCTVSNARSVRVFPEVRIAIDPLPTAGCAPLELSFDNLSLGADTHRWYYRIKGSSDQLEVINQAFPFWLLENSTSDSLIYEVVYEASNAFGCQESDTADVVVYPQIIADFIADPVRQTEPDTMVSLVNLTNNLNSWSYFWDFGDGDTSTLAEPLTHSFPGAGIYDIRLRATNPWCSDETVRTVVIEPTVPEVDFVPDTTAGCPGLTVNFTNLSRFADATTFEWDFGDGIGTSTLTNPSYTYNSPGFYAVSLQASNASGTEVVEIKERLIEIYEQPFARFGIRPEIAFLPDAIVFTDNRSTNADLFFWDFGDGFTSTEFEPSHRYIQQGDYSMTLVATSLEGCIDTLVRDGLVQVQDGGQIRIPNAFTPNEEGPSGGVGGGDGVNDVFLPLTTGVSEFQMQIYNRWGELLFESFDKEIGWDGYYRGEVSPPDVYIYRLNLTFANGQRTTRVGDVTLLR